MAEAASGGLTKGEFIEVAARYVVTTGQGEKVDGCEDIVSERLLVACLINNTHVDPELEGRTEDEVLYGTFSFMYMDYAGDCSTTVDVNGKKKKVVYDSGWDCY